MADDGHVQDDGDQGIQEDELVKKIQDLKAAEEGSVHDTYQAEIEGLKAAKQEAEGRAVRALADLKNAQRRMEEEKTQFAAFAGQKLVLQVLEIYENYHRLLQHVPETIAEGNSNDQIPNSKEQEEWLKGLELIDQQFGKFMEQQGVSLIEVKAGEQIDPEKHEAMMTGEGKDGEILEVFSPGYEMKGRVIKTAKVKVGKSA